MSEQEAWDTVNSWEELEEGAAPVKTVPIVPAFARRFPKRTLVLAGVAAGCALIYGILQSTIATAPATAAADPNAIFAPWRYAAIGVYFLWAMIISASGSLFSWLLHVRDKENSQRMLALAMHKRALVKKRTPNPHTRKRK